MLGDITAADELYIVTGYTDMRKSIDVLCAIIEDQLHMDPRRSALYLFCGKRCDRVKAFLWENDGFVLLYKRMEVKGRFRWPRSSQEVRQLTWQQFDWLMSGLEIEQPKAFNVIQFGKHLVELKRELNKAVGYKGVQLVTISRPTAYGEYAPYHFVDTEQEFQTIVKGLRP